MSAKFGIEASKLKSLLLKRMFRTANAFSGEVDLLNSTLNQVNQLYLAKKEFLPEVLMKEESLYSLKEQPKLSKTLPLPSFSIDDSIIVSDINLNKSDLIDLRRLFSRNFEVY